MMHVGDYNAFILVSKPRARNSPDGVPLTNEVSYHRNAMNLPKFISDLQIFSIQHNRL